MGKTIENPEAFPVIGDSINQNYIQKGMTLRDYFAVNAAQGILSNGHPHFFGNIEGLIVPDYLAEQSYKIADAMLKEREKDPNYNQ